MLFAVEIRPSFSSGRKARVTPEGVRPTEWARSTLLAQALNVTDEEFVTFGGGDERQVIDYQRYGRTYLVGLSYTFN